MALIASKKKKKTRERPWKTGGNNFAFYIFDGPFYSSFWTRGPTFSIALDCAARPALDVNSERAGTSALFMATGVLDLGVSATTLRSFSIQYTLVRHRM